MSGHSHSKNVKKTKEADAKKRSLFFSKIGKTISLSVKEKGGDINSNPSLRALVEKAKKYNMPKDNIEKAIKRGLGDIKGLNQLESFVFGAYGPGNIAIMAEGITDNKNRSIADFRLIVNKYNGKPADIGSVKWLFSHKQIIKIDKKLESEKAYLSLIDLGAEDVIEGEGFTEIKISPEKTEKIIDYLSSNSIDFESFLKWVPINTVKVSKAGLGIIEKIINELDDSEDVQSVYHNAEINI
jgi:YebC/PmpR family DNA-binding regulatory protein